MRKRVNKLIGVSGALALIIALGPGPTLSQIGGPITPLPQSINGTPNGTGFTYQGQLRKNGAPVNAACAFTFVLLDAATGGAQIGPPVISPTLQVSNGLFSIPLDFGPGAMNGEARWLETQVSCPGDGSPTTLSPRTALLPAPYALALPGMRTPRGDNDANGDATINVIGGTVSNTIATDSILSVIGGGSHNAIGNDSGGSTIAGGNTQVITNVSYNSTIGGGYSNTIAGRSEGAVLAGGIANIIIGNSDEAALGGGANNRIDGVSTWSVLGGGYANVITGSFYGVAGGGSANAVSASFAGVVAGGSQNALSASPYAAIAGGQVNTMTNSAYASIGGGRANTLISGGYGLIAGGWDNQITASPYASAIGGGISNTISSSNYGFIGGGFHNQVLSLSDSTVIAGGVNNKAELTSTLSFIGGGDINTIRNSSYKSVIGGGEFNTIRDDSPYSAIAGGWVNQISSGSDWSFIGGGHANTITGTASYAAIPGGESNEVRGDYALAAGRRAQALHNGAFVWGDSTNANVASTAPDQFVIRASGGVSLPVNAGNGGSHPFGEHWRDNAVQAWASVNAAGTLFASYGVSSVAHSTGIYTFTLQVGAVDNTRMAPVVTPEIDAPPTSAAAARLISINTINGTTFVVYITNGSFVLTDNDFVMMMTGR